MVACCLFLVAGEEKRGNISLLFPVAAGEQEWYGGCIQYHRTHKTIAPAGFRADDDAEQPMNE